ncbi:hypothetical protein AAHC03_0256 [Spirometra sp. Aus1]
MVDDLIRHLFFNAAKLIEEQIPLFVKLAISSLVLGFIQMYCLNLSSRRQGQRIRLLFFQSVLRQDASWYDSQASGSLISLVSTSVPQIQAGLGNRVGSFVRDFVLFVGCLIMAYIKGWKLALVASSMIPLIIISFAVLGFSLNHFNNREIRAYSRAGGISGEILSSIRTVFAYGAQEYSCKRYTEQLFKAERTGIKKSMALGAANGFVSFSIFSAAALVLWYGITLVRTERFSSGTVILVVVSIIISSISMGKALPEIEAIGRALSAAKKVYPIIDRVPGVNVASDGDMLPDLKGKIEFKNVSFAYPTRPAVRILKDFNLTIEPGQKVAIVGLSGSGKSTAIHLLQRFYDPESGEVLLDDHNVRNLHLGWLRQQLGVVAQEADLFSGTVADNIRLGLVNASDEEVEEAATLASAHDFIMNLPQGYDTWLDDGGAKLSGGQRQRISIARALIRKPKILLLDEATSALDTRSERAVQRALDAACAGRSVIMVAHRLTTVRNADKIIVMQEGEVVESGTHEELKRAKGRYWKMLQAQNLADDGKTGSTSSKSDDELQPLKADVIKRKMNEYDGEYVNNENLDDSTYVQEVKEEEYVVKPSLSLKEKFPMFAALSLNKPEYPYLFVGLLMAIAVGIIEPLFALVYSEMFDIFKHILRPNKMQSRANELALSMIFLGAMRMIATFFQRTFLGISGEKLTKRVRGLLFKSILKQEIAWFDQHENQPGILTASLAADAPSLEKISGSQLGVMVEATCLVIVSLAIACKFSWQLTLVNLAFFPFLVLTSVLQLKDVSSSEESKLAAGVSIAQETLNSHRTVMAFGLENYFFERYAEKSGRKIPVLDWSNIFFSIVSTVAQSMQYFQMATSFYVGATLLRRKEIGTFTVFRVFTMISFSAQGVGRAASFLPDLKSANTGARKIMQILRRKTQMPIDEGDEPDTPFSGAIEFRNLHFAYPDRKSTQVLQGFDHNVTSGSSVALVGQSGCGKSTILQLILRFYESQDISEESGIFMDGQNIKHLAPRWIRSHIGVVFQQSDLFDMTIRENIAFGDLTRELSMEEIIAAARVAKIHDFIMSLPEGYETTVGIRGSQLSGGQRQRLAIARAVVRKPTLLLLDEATSALDAENERAVQDALNETISSASMTCLVVAHRLSTVEACDCVVVVQDGRKAESGPPQDLLRAKGVFYALHSAAA